MDVCFFTVVTITSIPALANVPVVKEQGRNTPLCCSLQNPCYAPDSHLALACSLLSLSPWFLLLWWSGCFVPPSSSGRQSASSADPSPIPAQQQQPDRPISPEAEGLWGLLSSTLSKMKIIAPRKMHPFSFTNPWCGNVLTFNEVHLCRSAGSKGFTETRHWCSLLLPPPVFSLI